MGRRLGNFCKTGKKKITPEDASEAAGLTKLK
jgi:hypothetical protein